MITGDLKRILSLQKAYTNNSIENACEETKYSISKCK